MSGGRSACKTGFRAIPLALSPLYADNTPKGRDGASRKLECESIMREVLRICLVGLVIGILARFFYPGEVDMGIIKSVLLGLGGSVVGGVVPRLVSKDRAGEPYSPAGFIGSVLGAMGLIFIGNIL
jgi:uncharacterized membrane protein YeaQ/YmgE (transglycosylase-associated protein family)